MKKLPAIDTWFERIDANTVAVFAQRRWDSEPRYSVFVVVDDAQIKRQGEVFAQAAERLKAYERYLLNTYSRRYLDYWRAHVRVAGYDDLWPGFCRQTQSAVNA